jgi:ribosomal protein S27AE
MIQYSTKEVLDALVEMAQDKEAYNAFCNDFAAVLTKQGLLWLEKKKQSRQNGILVESKGITRLICPRCKSANMKDLTLCGQCGNQLQDTWIEKTRKKNHSV